MMMLLQAVVQHGTAAAASSMNHALGGKTGTTNDYTDAWFIGFSPSITCGTWVGFDDRRSLGEKETGARAALPIWMDFMKVAAGGPAERAVLARQRSEEEAGGCDHADRISRRRLRLRTTATTTSTQRRRRRLRRVLCLRLRPVNQAMPNDEGRACARTATARTEDVRSLCRRSPTTNSRTQGQEAEL